MKKALLILLFGWIQFEGYTQDIAVASYLLPQSGCNLTSTESVRINIQKVSGPGIVPANTITCSYQIDGGAVVNQLLAANLNTNFIFTFSTQTNLSACGAHTVKAWVYKAGDVNPLNDTLSWNIVNDCSIIPGSVQSSATVCSSGNAGTLNLVGWTNGSITNWDYSTNGGGSWTPIGNTATAYNYLNLTQSTTYRVRLEGGFCPDAISGTALITVQAPVIPGILSNGSGHCVSNVVGSLNAVGGTGSILEWQSSLNGSTWWPIANTSNTHNFSGITQTTHFRVLYEGSACPDVNSNASIITVSPVPNTGTMSAADSICSTTPIGVVSVTGASGSVINWQSSTNGTTWTSIVNSANALPFSGLTTTTYFQAVIDGGFCPDEETDSVQIYIHQAPIVPIISGPDSMCINNVVGNLSVLTNGANVLTWESSFDNGLSWNDLSNTTTTQTLTGLIIPALYRVVVDGVFCPNEASNQYKVFVEPLVVPGNIQTSDTFCLGTATGVLSSIGTLNPITQWEFSTNYGTSWTPITNTTSNQSFINLQSTTFYRLLAEGFLCPSAYSDTAIITVDNLSVGNLNGTDSICGFGNGLEVYVENHFGHVLNWSVSSDLGATWTTIPAGSDTLSQVSNDSLTYIVAEITNLVCPNAFTDTLIVQTDSIPETGLLGNISTFCPGEINAANSFPSSGSSFTWQFLPSLGNWTTIGVTDSSTFSAFTSSINGQFRVFANNGVCPADTSNAIPISVFVVTPIDIGPDISITEGDTVNLSFNSVSGGTWSPAIFIENSLIPNPNVWPSTTQEYTYLFIDNNGCSISDTLKVIVVPKLGFIIMNLITMNDDGKNDVWNISGISDFPNTDVKVFNVYGQLVYENENYINDWKGTFKEDFLPDGTYYYVVTKGVTKEVLKGTLTLAGNE